MILVGSRTALDKALADPKRPVLLIKGTKDSPAHAVHDAARKKKIPCFLVTDLSLISATEKTLWFGWTGGDRYALVDGEERLVVRRGNVAELLRKDGKPAMKVIGELAG